MVTLEQVRLLETKVAKAIDYVNQVSGENSRLRVTLESCRKRIDELEVLVQQFKEDQGRIEKGIVSALDRLNQFEDAIEKSLSSAGTAPAIIPEAESPDCSGNHLKAENFPPREPLSAAESGEGDLVLETRNQASGPVENPPSGDPGFSGGEPEMPEEPDLPGDTEDAQELDIF
ncbi:MAG: cell division protein ZapB [Treponema sp.]|jgi:hypothetical protein|nr:cell division protein ZapB [Treponema sp.]